MKDIKSFSTIIEGEDLLCILSSKEGLKFYNDETNEDIVVGEDIDGEESFIYNLIMENISSDCSEQGAIDMKWYFKGDCYIEVEKTKDGYYDLTIVDPKFVDEFLTIHGLNMDITEVVNNGF